MIRSHRLFQFASTTISLRLLLSFLVALACLAAREAPAALMLGTAGEYGEFILGNSTRSDVDAQGKVAVGGNANFTNFTVASQQPLNTTNLVVGGTLTAQSATVRGHIVTGGDATYTNPTVNGNFSSNAILTLGSGTVAGDVRYNTGFNQNGTVIGGSTTGGVTTPLPIDFAAEANFLTSLSLAQFNVNDPAPTFQLNQMFANGGAGTNFFNVTGAQLQSSTSGFHFDAPAGATMVINVSGTGFTIPNTGFDLTGGLTVDHLLFNFYEATSLTIQSSARGTFLAPLATISTSPGSFNGNLIAASLTGGIETHIFDNGNGPPTLFDGELRPPVPEPSFLAMMTAVATFALGRRR